VSPAYTKVKNAFKFYRASEKKTLRENTLFCLAATEAKKCCAMLGREPKIMQIPLGDQKAIFIA